MSWQNWLQVLALVASIFVVTRLLGPYLARVLDGGPAPGDRVFLPVERVIYRVSGVDPKRDCFENEWRTTGGFTIAIHASAIEWRGPRSRARAKGRR